MSDPVKIRQEMDQTSSMLVELAPVLRQFYTALRASGFTEGQTMRLLVAYMDVAL